MSLTTTPSDLSPPASRLEPPREKYGHGPALGRGWMVFERGTGTQLLVCVTAEEAAAQAALLNRFSAGAPGKETP